jgi:hypothetical protein
VLTGLSKTYPNDTLLVGAHGGGCRCVGSRTAVEKEDEGCLVGVGRWYEKLTVFVFCDVVAGGQELPELGRWTLRRGFEMWRRMWGMSWRRAKGSLRPFMERRLNASFTLLGTA